MAEWHSLFFIQQFLLHAKLGGKGKIWDATAHLAPTENCHMTNTADEQL